MTKMKKWTVTVRGRLEFDREIVLFAESEQQAVLAADAVMRDVMNKSDELEIDEFHVNEFKEDDGSAKYEVGFYMKDSKSESE